MSSTRKHPPAEVLWGKRLQVRQARALSVVCAGTGAAIRGRTIDLSRGGMLVEAHLGDLSPVGAGDLLSLALFVEATFRHGMTASLGPEVSVRAEVIRVTTSPVDRGFLRLGCRFERLLTPRHCRLLGIDQTEGPDLVLDLAPRTQDGGTAAISPVELIEVTARPERRRPVVKLVPLRDRRKRNV